MLASSWIHLILNSDEKEHFIATFDNSRIIINDTGLLFSIPISAVRRVNNYESCASDSETFSYTTNETHFYSYA